MDLNRPLAVVTPTLDGDVLYRLALVDAAFTPGRLQQLIPTASVDGVRRSLNRLAAQGVVEAESTAHAFTYRLNRDHVAAGPVLQLAKLWDVVLERITKTLGGWGHPPTYAAVFGSWARREAGPTSDVDLFLVRPESVPDQAWDEQIEGIERELTRWTGNDARAFVLTESQVHEHPDDPVLRSVVVDGLTVRGDRDWLANHVGTAATGGGLS